MAHGTCMQELAAQLTTWKDQLSTVIAGDLTVTEYQQKMSKSDQAIAISLKGSTDIVTEFFNFSINTILYQRGIYPPESFKKLPKYGLSMMVTTDEGLSAYLANINRQLDSE